MPVELFGTTRAGVPVHRITLETAGLRVALLTLGAILHDLRRTAEPTRPLTVGVPDLAAYDGGPLATAGALVGPMANRIGHARAPLDGTFLHFEPNATGGHHLHSGTAGLHAKVWQIDEISDTSATLTASAEPGEGGLPGARRFTASWRLADASLHLRLTAETDAPTLMSIANHSYWSLDPALDGQTLHIAADSVLETDPTVLPTGRRLPVAGTRFDFRSARALTASDRLDTCYCTADTASVALRPVASLAAADGLTLSLATTAPGLQAYTADGFSGAGLRDHAGRSLGPRFGLALEPQLWPDAPNHPDFPPIRLASGAIWTQDTTWTLTAPGESA